MKNFKLVSLYILFSIFISACGGGSSSSNTEANVTNECLGTRNASNIDTTERFNSCDFAVNYRATSRIDSEPVVINNIQPNQRIAFSFIVALSENFILCRAPSLPNENATRCT